MKDVWGFLQLIGLPIIAFFVIYLFFAVCTNVFEQEKVRLQYEERHGIIHNIDKQVQLIGKLDEILKEIKKGRE